MSRRRPHALQQRWQAWQARRFPARAEQQLNQRRIFILPTRLGGLFLGVALLIFLGGINYENNLMLGLAFLLVSLFVVAIVHTYRNLAGLTLRNGGTQPGFAHANGAFGVQLQAGDRRPHWSLAVAPSSGEAVTLSVPAGSQQTAWLPMALSQRGWQAVPRLRVSSRYPLGLLQAWSWIRLEQRCLAWPQPLAGSDYPGAGGGQRENAAQQADANELFTGHRRYREGDRLRDVDWRAYARGRGLLVMEREVPDSGGEWLDWDALAGLDTELRLSRLAHWVLVLRDRGQRFGLRLPDGELPLGQGPQHAEAALTRLAEFGAPS